MSQYTTLDEIKAYSSVASDFKSKCKVCGSTRLLSKEIPKAICNTCGNYIFLNKQEEFKHRLKEASNKIK